MVAVLRPLHTTGLVCTKVFSVEPRTDGDHLSLSLSLPVRTALIAIIGFMPTKGEGAIGSLDYTPEERRALAKKYDLVELCFLSVTQC